MKMRQILELLILAFLTACDPGMSIRQRDATLDSGAVSAPKVSIEVKMTNQLIGDRWYNPRVTVTNLSDSPITITGVDLLANGVTYENQAHEAGLYPLTLPARGATPIEVSFHFSEGVHRVFNRSAELRVQYRSAGRNAAVFATLVGGSPSTR